MTNLLQQFKKKFESKHKKCPNCRAELGKNAKICPECGHNFLYKAEPRTFSSMKLNSENCCSIFLIILIAIALLYFAFPVAKTIFLIIGIVAAVAILVILIMFAGLIYRIRGFFLGV